MAIKHFLQLTDFLGTATSSLQQLVVVPGAGLGGRVVVLVRGLALTGGLAGRGKEGPAREMKRTGTGG